MKITDAVLRRAGRLLSRESTPIGLRIQDRYEVEGRLARGGMGEIFRAQDTQLGRPVAMKVLSAALSEPEWAVRFETEARTMGGIDHPGIVPIHDLGKLPDGRIFYTMKLLEGSTLDERIRRKDPLPELLRTLADTCRTVHHAHEEGIVHRDLKPSNVMVDGSGQVYVLDWGIARVRDEFQAMAGEGAMEGMGLTAAGTVLGTAPYMSPEQARGDLAAVDARSDVYALGAVLYEILTSVPPVSGVNVTEILGRVAEGRIDPPRTRSRRVPHDLDRVTMKALALRPEDRYPSAEAMALELERWLAHEPVEAVPPNRGYRLAKSLRRRPAVWASAAVAVLLAASLAVSWVATAEERALAALKRGEEKVFAPIREKLAVLPGTPEGRQEGIWILQEGLRRYEDSWAGWMLLGELEEKDFRFEDALGSYQEALRRNPALGTAHYYRGRIYLDRLKDHDAARREFEASLRVNPGHEDALLWRARIAMLSGDYPEALDLCRRAEPIARHHRELYSIRGHIYHLEGAGPLRDLPRSIEELTRQIEIDPTDYEAYEHRGKVKHLAGDDEGAVKDYDRAIELYQKSWRSWFGRADAKEELEDWKGAVEDYDRAIELYPENPESYNNRANARDELGDLTGARSDYDKAIELDPDEALPYYNRGLLSFREQDWDGVVADNTEAIKRKPDYMLAFYNRGLAFHRSGRLEKAVDDFTKAIELAPKRAMTYVARAHVRRHQEKSDLAMEDCHKATQIDPKMSRAWLGLALGHYQNWEYQDALRTVTRAVELAPRDVYALYNRGIFRTASGDYEGALADYARVLEIDPGHYAAMGERGDVRRYQNETDKAASEYLRALVASPGNWRRRQHLERWLHFWKVPSGPVDHKREP